MLAPDKPAPKKYSEAERYCFGQRVNPGWIRCTGAGNIPALAENPA